MQYELWVNRFGFNRFRNFNYLNFFNNWGNFLNFRLNIFLFYLNLFFFNNRLYYILNNFYIILLLLQLWRLGLNYFLFLNNWGLNYRALRYFWLWRLRFFTFLYLFLLCFLNRSRLCRLNFFLFFYANFDGLLFRSN